MFRKDLYKGTCRVMVRVRLSDATLVGSVMDFLRLSSLDPKRVDVGIYTPSPRPAEPSDHGWP